MCIKVLTCFRWQEKWLKIPKNEYFHLDMSVFFLENATTRNSRFRTTQFDFSELFQ